MSGFQHFEPEILETVKDYLTKRIDYELKEGEVNTQVWVELGKVAYELYTRSTQDLQHTID